MNYLRRLLEKGVSPLFLVGFLVLTFFLTINIEQRMAFENLGTSSVNQSLKEAFDARDAKFPNQFKSVACVFKHSICRVRDTSDVVRDVDISYLSAEDASVIIGKFFASSAEFGFQLLPQTGEVRSTIRYPERLNVKDAAEIMEKIVQLVIQQQNEAVFRTEQEKKNAQSWGLDSIPSKR